MKRWWPREVLRFVDAWACREGTPEDDEDEKVRAGESPREDFSGGHGHGQSKGDNDEGGDVQNEASTSRVSPKTDEVSPDREIQSGGNDASQDWVELDFYPHADEEIGRKGR